MPTKCNLSTKPKHIELTKQAKQKIENKNRQ